jgi:hypothetical protein
MEDKDTIKKLVELLVEVSRELTANDVITQILREEKGLPHSTNPLLIAVNEAIKTNLQ